MFKNPFFTKKKTNIVVDTIEKEVDSVEIWMVYWNARYGNYSKDIKPVSKAFLNEKDAIEFRDSLHMAQKILCNTEDLGIKIEKL